MSNFKGWTSEDVDRAMRTIAAQRAAPSPEQLQRMGEAARARIGGNKQDRADDRTAAEIGKMSDADFARNVGALVKAKAGQKMSHPEGQRKKNPEYRIQADFVKLMNARRPEVLVFSDTAAHIKKTKIQQMRANALSSPREKWPDVFIAQPSGDYAGFWIEFKADSPFKKDGVTLLKNDHIEAQAATMERLRSKGYKCEFAWSAEMAFEMVEAYLNL